MATLITPNVDYKVVIHQLKTDDGLDVPNDVATVRVNTDDSRQVLAVVGRRYQVVQHRNAISDFDNALREAGLTASVTHDVFRGGARVYSRFTIDDPVSVQVNDQLKQAHPFFTLTNSYDGALKVGFLNGARISGVNYYLSPKLYEVYAKHLTGFKLDLVLDEVKNSLSTFINDVIPLWKKMMLTKLTMQQATDMLATAVKKHVISKRRAESIGVSAVGSVWDLCEQIVKEVSQPASEKHEAESGIWRNAKASEYFIDELKRLAQ